MHNSAQWQKDFCRCTPGTLATTRRRGWRRSSGASAFQGEPKEGARLQPVSNSVSPERTPAPPCLEIPWACVRSHMHASERARPCARARFFSRGPPRATATFCQIVMFEDASSFASRRHTHPASCCALGAHYRKLAPLGPRTTARIARNCPMAMENGRRTGPALRDPLRCGQGRARQRGWGEARPPPPPPTALLGRLCPELRRVRLAGLSPGGAHTQRAGARTALRCTSEASPSGWQPHRLCDGAAAAGRQHGRAWSASVCRTRCSLAACAGGGCARPGIKCPHDAALECRCTLAVRPPVRRTEVHRLRQHLTSMCHVGTLRRLSGRRAFRRASAHERRAAGSANA